MKLNKAISPFQLIRLCIMAFGLSIGTNAVASETYDIQSMDIAGVKISFNSEQVVAALSKEYDIPTDAFRLRSRNVIVNGNGDIVFELKYNSDTLVLEGSHTMV